MDTSQEPPVVRLRRLIGFLSRARREKKLCILTIIATRSNAWLSVLHNVLDCFVMGRDAYKPDTQKNKRAADNLQRHDRFFE